jgi:hypothetical protein
VDRNIFNFKEIIKKTSKNVANKGTVPIKIAVKLQGNCSWDQLVKVHGNVVSKKPMIMKSTKYFLKYFNEEDGKCFLNGRQSVKKIAPIAILKNTIDHEVKLSRANSVNMYSNPQINPTASSSV